MLRLTRVTHGSAGVTLVIEGQIVASWSSFLAGECRGVLAEGLSLCLDLGGVTYVDSRGIGMLRQLRPHRVTFIQCSPLVEELLRDVESA